MVSSYLVHHGYCSTATAFARVTDTTIQEEQTSIKNRQSKYLRCHSSSVFPLGHCKGVSAVEVTPWESTELSTAHCWPWESGALFPSSLRPLHPLPSLSGDLPCSFLSLSALPGLYLSWDRCIPEIPLDLSSSLQAVPAGADPLAWAQGLKHIHLVLLQLWVKDSSSPSAHCDFR